MAHRVRSGRRRSDRPSILVLNQYYWPGFEATAHLLSDLCEALADEFDITVVTGALATPLGRPGRIERNGVRIIRVRSTSFERSKLLRRAVNYLSYLLLSLRAGMTLPRPDVVLCMTDPPIIADVALVLARRYRVSLIVISQDVFPEVAVELRRFENPLLIGLVRQLVRFYLRRADHVVAIGETMRRRLVAKGVRPERITVIPNWVDTREIRPVTDAGGWATEHGLAGRFVVMHSGNVGHAQNLDSLIRAATFLRDLDDLVVAVIGSGARHRALVELSNRLETDNVVFLPYQPREVLPRSLSTADIHVVGLARGLSGYVVPSRLYGVLAAGKPVIVAADSESETAQLVERIHCGVVIPPGRPELLAGAIRAAYDGEYDLEGMGRLAREYVTRDADRSVAVARYRALLRELVGRGS